MGPLVFIFLIPGCLGELFVSPPIFSGVWKISVFFNKLKMQGLNLLLVLAIALGVSANCPGNMENIHGKCYMFDSASSREDAKAKCEAEAPGNHLWLINDQQEMENILEWFTKKNEGKLIKPWAWTDGIKKPHTDDIWIWESTGARINHVPDGAEGQICDGQCVSPDCGTATMGDCVTLSVNDLGARSYQGCACDEDGDIMFVCESPDEVDWECPEENGFFPSAPCSDLWYNCWEGHATPEYCDEGIVFNPEVQYCDFPGNVDGC
ncbi:uncharacterized protein LOC111701795 isoform X2 [Eurytemora carolleeae]|uniref:uncharacterized protein LOC111701795 isoform X2 n=1 Tax=Eurytemora carolleeae TaxID=1294199 RepID=UPI000C76090F|nr:uncharacterized protein LOC111701795 isoform X2 [Eurytemora carolleeae]|eukprot:XP_023328988.1 uncharacterized protein LOC111701795 isoform X2 [Eurytemora affinis]